MKRILIYVAAVLCLCASGCKTTEANYRAAYDKAMAGRAERDSLEQTIYGRHRQGMGTHLSIYGTDSADVKTQRVRVTETGGGVREWLKPYSVVAVQMKQLFNAVSLRERLVDNGYPRAFVVETAEPYYYIVVESFPTEEEAVRAASALRRAKDFPVPMRRPLPIVLHNPGQK